MKVPEPKKLPSGKYNVRIMLNGKSYSITRDTARECKNEAMMMKAEYKTKNRIADKCLITLRSAIDNYIDVRSSVLSPSTIRGYRVVQRNYFTAVMDRRIDAIDWQREVNAMAQNYAPKTVRNAWRFVSSVLSENGVQAKKITLPQLEAEEHLFLDKEQIKLFVDAVKGKQVEIPALLALHSLRRSEIAGLDWKNIDLKKKTITVSGSVVPNEANELVYKKMAKNDSSARTIDIMIPSLFDALKSADNKSGKVCTMHPNSIYKAVNSICRENGLPEVGVHGLRHSCVSLCYALGLSEMQTMRIGGYSDWATMRKIYTHLDSLASKDASTKIQNFFSDLT